MREATLKTYSNSPELDKGGENHVLGSDRVSARIVPRCRVFNEVVLKIVIVEYSDGRD